MTVLTEIRQLIDEAEQLLNLDSLTGPPGPIVEPADCPGYGRNVPRAWRCPTCPLSVRCWDALEARKYNGGSDEKTLETVVLSLQ